MLLPDQTYEQCQDMLAPLVALKRILNDTESKPQIETEYKGKCNIVEDQSEDSGDEVNEKDDIVKCGPTVDNATDAPGDKDTDERLHTPESYDQTSDFFNNVPDFNGEPLGPFSISYARDSQRTSADLMKECELFLHRHRIRPDFFCRYRKAMEYVLIFTFTY